MSITRSILSKLKYEFSFLKGNFLILIITWILMDFTREIPETYYPLYVIALGGSPFIIGIIGLASFIVLAIVQIPGGYLADKIGRRKLIVTMTFATSFSYLIFAIAPSWHYILIGMIFMNLCLIYLPALYALIADSVPPDRRGMAYSISNLIMATSTIPSPIIAGLLYKSLGLVNCMRLSYFITFIAFIIAACLRFKLKETLHNIQKISTNEIFKIYIESMKEFIITIRKLPIMVTYVIIISIVSTFGFNLCQYYWILYATEVLGIDKFTWAIILTWFSIILIITSIPCGKLIDVIGRRNSLIIAYSLFSICLLLFIYGDVIKVFISFTIGAISHTLFISSEQALLADIIPKEHRGKILGMYNFLNYIVTAIAISIGGYLYEKISPALPFMLCLIINIITLIMIITLVKEPKIRFE